jgi:hypothetical protein
MTRIVLMTPEQTRNAAPHRTRGAGVRLRVVRDQPCARRRLRHHPRRAGRTGLTELLMLVSLYYGPALVLNAADLELDKTARLKA